MSGRGDTISREEALQILYDFAGCIVDTPNGDYQKAYKIYRDKLKKLPHEPDTDEWCTDCKEYDHERHCCPRWSRVIRETLKDAQIEKRTEERTKTHACDCISRAAAIEAYGDWYVEEGTEEGFIGTLKQLLEGLPSAQPFHNITMNDVLKYIDDMPEDVWQEFTACLECRGWELQRKTAKWCGGEFA